MDEDLPDLNREPNPAAENESDHSIPLQQDRLSAINESDLPALPTGQAGITTSDIQNMEVHHHPHVEKKNFKEYLLEGLMIFIAVTMGFFAESLREYLNEKRATTENMQSMIEDLRSDSSMFSGMLAGNEYSIRMIDTLVDMLGSKSKNTGHIYFLARNITAVADAPRPDTRTFEQMRTEGSLRLLKSKSLVNNITSYYQSLEWFKMGNDGELKRMDEVITANSAIFDGTVLKNIFTSEFINAEHNSYKIIEPNGSPPLFSNENSYINTIIVRYSYLQSALKENNGTIELEMKRSKQLIQEIENEYYLKNE